MALLKKIYKKYQGLSLRSRRLGVFAIISVLTTLLFVFLYYRQTNQIILDDAVNSKRLIMQYFKNDAGETLRSATSILYRLSYDETVRQALEGNATSEESLQEEKRNLNKIIYSQILKPNFTSARVFFVKDKPYTENSHRFFSIHEVELYDWYDAVVTAEGSVVWTKPYKNNSGAYQMLTTISAARALMSWDNPGVMEGMLVVDFDINLMFRQLLLSARKMLNGDIYIINADQEVVCSLINTDLGLPIQEIESFKSYEADQSRREHDGYIILTEPLSYPNEWSVVLSFETEPLIQNNQEGFNKYLYSLLAVMIIALVLNLASARIFSNQLERMAIMLQRSIGATNQAQASPKVLHKKLESYMVLSSKSQALLNTINEMELQRTEAQLSAMRSKINPHFLYNQLDTINWMAIRSGAPEVADAVRRLSRYYRAHLAKGDDIITLKRELGLLESYIDLMKMRTKDSINYVIKCDESVKEYLVCNMILQPLVENAIEHGIMEKEYPTGTISVEVTETETHLVICVKDDGAGIPSSVLSELNERYETKKNISGYGYYNVDRRVRLYFGEESGLFAESNGSGTVITIRIPKLRSLNK